MASAGAHTIGSLSLKEVLTTAGVPVSLANSLISSPVSGIGFAIDGLQAAGAVDVGSGGQRVTFVLAQRNKQKS